MASARLLLVTSLLVGCSAVGDIQPNEAAGDAVSRVIDDVCDARLVFLGEEQSHGGGRSIRVKSDVVRGLIRKCGFTHVAFESQIYDFVDLQERYATGTATLEALYDAIGGLWSRAAEIDPLVQFLHEEAKARRIAISGIDINAIGATGFYSQTRLAGRLSRSLPADRQKECLETIGRLTGWKFDRSHPKDKAFDEATMECAREIEASSILMNGRGSTAHVLARSLRSFLEDSEASDGELRDKMMYENLEWAIERSGTNARTIVWTATIHSLRAPMKGHKAMASYVAPALAANTKSIAFVAVSGTVSAGGRQVEIADAEPDSLEAIFSPGGDAQESYVDKSHLQKAGTRRSRVIGYGRYVESDWSEHLDGAVVMAAEASPTYVRAARPMQAAGNGS